MIDLLRSEIDFCMIKAKFIIIFFFCIYFVTVGPAHAAAPVLSFTVNMSENVTVDTAGGVPRIALNVGGVTRYASYASGSGAAALVFTYTATPGDVDLDGVSVSSPVDLNGGFITDLAGNALSNLTFTPPTTTNVRVDYPSMSMNFGNGPTGRYTLSGDVYNSLSSFLTAAGTSFTRSTTATYFDSTGTLQTAAINTPRFDYNPSTLAFRGLLIERARTNGVRNNTMVGAVAGTPGTPPTNWGITSTISGISRQIIGTGTENGINYIDIRFFGTSTAGPLYPGIYFDGPINFSITTGAIVTASAYVKLVGGSLTNTTTHQIIMYNSDSGGTSLSQFRTASCAPTSSGLAQQRCEVSTISSTFSNGSTAYARPYWQFVVNSAGLAVDFTIRVGMPQIELGSFATSVIPTTSAAVTRQLDVMSIPTGTWYNQSAGSFFANVGWASSSGANFPMLARFDDTTTNNRWNVYYNQAANRIGIDAYSLGASQGFFNSALQSTSGTIKTAAAQGTNTANAAYNGTLGTIDTVWSPPTVTQFSTDANNARIWINNLKYYPVRVADTQLQLLTQ